MIFQGFKITEGMLEDLHHIKQRTGTTKSQLIRDGLNLLIAEFYKKEEIKKQYQERHTNPQREEGWMSLPDGW